MGEILRAVMEKNCVYSQASYFSLPLSVASTPGTPSFARRQTSVQWKTDSWFLVIGWAQFTAFANVGILGWSPPLYPSTFVLAKGNNQEQFEFNAPSPAALHNGNLNDFVSLDEYPLIAPGELVTVFEDVQTTNTGSPFTRTTTVTLAGVEYQMPPRPGGSL
jgi:hypothetical protein